MSRTFKNLAAVRICGRRLFCCRGIAGVRLSSGFVGCAEIIWACTYHTIFVLSGHNLADRYLLNPPWNLDKIVNI